MLQRKTITGLSLGAAILFLPFSILLCHVSLGIFLVCWASEGRWREKASMLAHSPFVWAYVVFFMLHLIGISYSENKEDAWFNLEKKITLLLLPVAIASSLEIDRGMIRTLFKTFILACLVATAICLSVAYRHYLLPADQGNFDFAYMALFEKLNPSASPNWILFSYVGLADGIGMHPTFLAMYLAFGVMLLYHLYGESVQQMRNYQKLILVLVVLFFAVSIVLLSSRIVAVAFLCLCIAGIYDLAGRYVRYAVAASVLLGAVLSITLLDPVSRYRSLQEPFVVESYQPDNSGMYVYSTGIRKSLWTLGFLAMSEVNPVMGAGIGDVNDTVRKIGERSGIKNSIDSFDPHNEFIFIQVGLGCIGLLSLLACFLLPAWSAYHQKHFLYIGFIFLFGSVCMTESALESQKGIVFFTIFNSILVFQYFKLEPVVLKKLVYG